MHANNPLAGYSLILAGHAWHFLATDDASAVVDRFAKITDLKKGYVPGSTRLIYTRSGRPDMGVIKGAEDLPESGWAAAKMGLDRFWSHAEVPDVICDIGPESSAEEEVIKLSYSLFPLYRQSIYGGGAPIHAALVERAGHGVLLAASGGTGKSTCSERIQPPWRALCDDLGLVVRDSQGYSAHPFPTWSNFFFDRPKQSWDIQEHVALDAFFFLEQAPEDSVEAIGRGGAAMRIYNSSIQVCFPMFRMMGADSQPLRQQLFNNACEMSKVIPSYKLRVKLTGSFWEEMDRVLMET